LAAPICSKGLLLQQHNVQRRSPVKALASTRTTAQCHGQTRIR
jgi:hypothetical protein